MDSIAVLIPCYNEARTANAGVFAHFPGAGALRLRPHPRAGAGHK